MLHTAFWMVLPAVVYGLLASLLTPDDPPRWTVRARRVLRPAGRLGARLWELHRPVRHPEAVRPTDPFAVLAVQTRLGLLARQVQALEGDPRVWARAKRLQATQAAYDDVLAEACLLAGIDLGDLEVTHGHRPTEPERFREEMELASRGWSW